MEPTTVFSIALCVFGFGLIASRIQGSPITAPMLFLFGGLLAGPSGLNVVRVHGEGVDFVIELTLTLVLFSDASRIRFSELRRGYAIPARLLAIGMPLTIVLGSAVAWLIFPEFSIAEALLLGAVLAPTDAALGLVVVSSRRVPIRIRQAINVESGLNDGIAVPVVTVLLAAAATGSGSGGEHGAFEGPLFALQQIGLGPIAGILVAWPAARLVQRTADAGRITRPGEHFASLAIALGAFAGAELIHGNGFIAAFTAGLVLGNTTTTVREAMQEFAEEGGELLALLAFLVFGAAMLPAAFESLDLRVVGYIVLSLTLIRMVPATIGLLGSGLSWPTVGFLGWFGPRGLATILFALLIRERESIPHHALLFHIAALAVAASTLAHGLSAAPLARRYGRWASRVGAETQGFGESLGAPDLPVRGRMLHERDTD